MRKLRLLSTAAVAATLATLGFASPTSATFPGHNGLIAFAVPTGSTYQIYSIRPNGQNLQQLTHLAGNATSPDWSPDGRRIAFEFDAPDGSCSVEIMNRGGGGIVDLTKDTNVCEATPSFTPDGSHIVFERNDPATKLDAIWMMNLTGGDRHKITAGIGEGVTNPVVSPNGKLLSFLAFNTIDPGPALYTVQIDGSHLQQVVPFSFDVAINQEWAPDGRHIEFTYNGYARLPGLSANIATIRPDGTHLEHLTHYSGGQFGAYGGSYSPNGKWVVFRLTDFTHLHYELCRMNTGGGAVHAILPFSSFRPRFIDWGPAER
jgi:Tol biopolymer transport system component